MVPLLLENGTQNCNKHYVQKYIIILGEIVRMFLQPCLFYIWLLYSIFESAGNYDGFPVSIYSVERL